MSSRPRLARSLAVLGLLVGAALVPSSTPAAAVSSSDLRYEISGEVRYPGAAAPVSLNGSLWIRPAPAGPAEVTYAVTGMSLTDGSGAGFWTRPEDTGNRIVCQISTNPRTCQPWIQLFAASSGDQGIVLRDHFASGGWLPTVEGAVEAPTGFNWTRSTASTTVDGVASQEGAAIYSFNPSMPLVATPSFTATPTTSAALGAVQDVQVIAGDAQATISWSAPAEGSLSAERYRVFVDRPPFRFFHDVEEPNLPAVLTDLANGAEHSVRVLPMRGNHETGLTTGLLSAAARVTPVGSTVATTVEAGQPATATTGAHVNEQDPIATAVSVPAGLSGGALSIVETETPTTAAPSGYSIFGHEVQITAPARTAETPLELTFLLDASLIPDGASAADITLIRTEGADTVALPPCTGGGKIAVPDPCVYSRVIDADGDLTIVALTSHASTWNTALVPTRTTKQAPARGCTRHALDNRGCTRVASR